MNFSILFRLTAIFILGLCLLVASGASETATPASGLKLEEIAICRKVVNRTPIGRGSVFSVNVKKIYCFTKVVGASADTEIVHKWFLNGELKSTVRLPVKSASWRTWSSKKIELNDSGDWMVEIMTSDETSLESVLFFVQ